MSKQYRMVLGVVAADGGPPQPLGSPEIIAQLAHESDVEDLRQQVMQFAARKADAMNRRRQRRGGPSREQLLDAQAQKLWDEVDGMVDLTPRVTSSDVG